VSISQTVDRRAMGRGGGLFRCDGPGGWRLFVGYLRLLRFYGRERRRCLRVQCAFASAV